MFHIDTTYHLLLQRNLGCAFFQLYKKQGVKQIMHLKQCFLCPSIFYCAGL